MLLALLGEAQHDPEMARTFHERYLGPQRERERTLLRRGITSGELAAGLDADAALDALCGPVFYRALTGADIPQAFIDGLVGDVLGRHVASSGRAGGAGADDPPPGWRRRVADGVMGSAVQGRAVGGRAVRGGLSGAGCQGRR